MQHAKAPSGAVKGTIDAILVRLAMEGFAEAEPRLTVGYLVTAIAPIALQKQVKELLQLHQNRGLKKIAREFKLWLENYMGRYGEFEQLLLPIVKTAVDRPDKTDGRSGKPDGRRFETMSRSRSPNRKPKAKVVDVNFTKGKVCFKCLSQEHNVSVLRRLRVKLVHS